MQDIGTLGGNNTYPFDVNRYGTVVGYSNPFGDVVGRAFIFKNGSLRALGTLGGQVSQASGLNDSGQIVGWSDNAARTWYHAALFENGVPRDLGTLGGTRSEAYAISESGIVVGRSYTGNDAALHAFSFDGVNMHDLGTLGGPESIAYAINEFGLIIGTAQSGGNGVFHAYVHDGITMRDLGTPGGTQSSAYGINARGTIVGEFQTPDFDRHAFLNDDAGMHDLNDLIDTTSGWVIKDARGINDRGQIAANGCLPTNECRALRLDPIQLGVSLARFKLKASVIAGCSSGTATVTLSGPAPKGGFVLNVGDNLSSVSTPQQVVVAEGALSKSFAIKTAPVLSHERGSVTVSNGDIVLAHGLSVRPMGIASISLSPLTQKGGKSVAGTVTLECKAGPGPISVALASSNTTVANPSSPVVQIPAGTQSAGFMVTTRKVSTRTPLTITATANTLSANKQLTVTP